MFFFLRDLIIIKIDLDKNIFKIRKILSLKSLKKCIFNDSFETKRMKT